MSKRWDCHDHRDELQVSHQCTVYHPEHGQLCYGMRQFFSWLYFPIRFGSRAAALKWVESGWISELQEGLSVLNVGFTKVCMETSEEYDARNDRTGTRSVDGEQAHIG